MAGAGGAALDFTYYEGGTGGGDDDIESGCDLPDFNLYVTDSGDVFVAPGTVLRFSSDGSRDMDLAFDGMLNPDPNAPDWNGIVGTTWNWGDAAPPSHENDAWHIFEQPGYYTVTLTVRDGYGTGDSNS